MSIGIKSDTIHQVTILHHIPYSVPSDWCHDERPHSGTVPYMEGIALIQLLQDTTCDSFVIQPSMQISTMIIIALIIVQ